MANETIPIVRPTYQRSPAQIRTAIERFKRLLGDLENFDPPSVRSRLEPHIEVLAISIKEALMEAFGYLTPQYNLYKAAVVIDTARHNYTHEVPRTEIIKGLERGKERAIALLGQAIKFLEGKLAELGEPAVHDAGAKTLPCI